MYTKLCLSGVSIPVAVGMNKVFHVSFPIDENGNPLDDSEINCERKNAHIIKLYGTKEMKTSQRRFNLTDEDKQNLENRCVCKNRCMIPPMAASRNEEWKLHIYYKCQGIDGRIVIVPSTVHLEMILKGYNFYVNFTSSSSCYFEQKSNVDFNKGFEFIDFPKKDINH